METLYEINAKYNAAIQMYEDGVSELVDTETGEIIPIEDWLERLQDDLDNGTTHAWTTVPDVVTDFLKDSGYDGIVDQGGKTAAISIRLRFRSTPIRSKRLPMVILPTVRISVLKAGWVW